MDRLCSSKLQKQQARSRTLCTKDLMQREVSLRLEILINLLGKISAETELLYFHLIRQSKRTLTLKNSIVESIRALKYGINQFNKALRSYGDLHGNYTNNDDDVIEYLSVKTSDIMNDIINVKRLISNMGKMSPICFVEIQDAIKKIPIINFPNDAN